MILKITLEVQRAYSGRVELPIPISVNAFEKQSYRPKSKSTKLNFESIYEPNLGFYASYCDLDILESFISIKPFEKKKFWTLSRKFLII